jgi:hypothetical protein
MERPSFSGFSLRSECHVCSFFVFVFVFLFFFFFRILAFSFGLVNQVDHFALSRDRLFERTGDGNPSDDGMNLA